MSTTPSMDPQLILQLHSILRSLTASPYPTLPSPESTNRRASVALIIRVQPSYAHWPSREDRAESLDDFFAQDWVQYGQPEVLFIKRASRKGDRWTSHIALPGGKKDPEDIDDQAAAAREAWEEVGVDLDTHSLSCGNLPQRLVTTHWGKKPLLVLCPYVYLLTTHKLPPLKLQPTEVAAIHWVPIRNLQARPQRTVAFEDVSSRLANQETGVKKWMLSLILGKMMFAAITLLPTESLHSAETPIPSAAIQLQDNRHVPSTSYTHFKSLFSRVHRLDIFNQFPVPPKEGPLLLWGLTLGVVSDFLDLIPPHNALTLWTYPTFTPLDVRFTVWLLTYNFKQRKQVELQSGTLAVESGGFHKPVFGGVTESLASAASSTAESTVLVDQSDETGLHGLGTGSIVKGEQRPDKKAAVSTMLEGLVESLAQTFLPKSHTESRSRYYDIVRRAVAVALVGRAGLVLFIAGITWQRIRRRRSMLK